MKSGGQELLRSHAVELPPPAKTRGKPGTVRFGTRTADTLKKRVDLPRASSGPPRRCPAECQFPSVWTVWRRPGAYRDESIRCRRASGPEVVEDAYRLRFCREIGVRLDVEGDWCLPARQIRMETKCSFSLLLVISGMGGRSTHPPGLAWLAGAQRMGGKGRYGRARSAQRTATRLSLTCRCRRDGSIGLTGHLDGGGAGVTGERGGRLEYRRRYYTGS